MAIVSQSKQAPCSFSLFSHLFHVCTLFLCCDYLAPHNVHLHGQFCGCLLYQWPISMQVICVTIFRGDPWAIRRCTFLHHKGKQLRVGERRISNGKVNIHEKLPVTITLVFRKWITCFVTNPICNVIATTNNYSSFCQRKKCTNAYKNEQQIISKQDLGNLNFTKSEATWRPVATHQRTNYNDIYI